jgi:hypothetical protein
MRLILFGKQRTAALLVLLTAAAAGCGGPGDLGESSAASGAAPVPAGDAEVQVHFNRPPAITSLTGRQLVVLGAGEVVAEVEVAAVDDDGDELGYAWSSPSCPEGRFTFPDPADPARARFEVAMSDRECEVRVEVKDYWPGRTPPAGSGLSPERGGLAVGSLRLSRPPALEVGAGE